MALIIQRRKIFSVVYQTKEKGKIVPKLEAFFSQEMAEQRKQQIEADKIEVAMKLNVNMKIKDYLQFYMKVFGKNLLSLKVFDDYNSNIENYINPIIGEDRLNQIDHYYISEFFGKLKKTKVVDKRIVLRNPDTLVSAGTVERSHRILKAAFDIASQCDLFTLNPFDIDIDYGKTAHRDVDEWSEENVIQVFDECTKAKLFITLNLMFGCRLGAKEVLGLTWDNVHIEDDLYVRNQCYLVLDKELGRISLRGLNSPMTQKVIKVFDPVSNNGETRLALMSRYNGTTKVPIPLPVVKILRNWKKVQNEHIRKHQKKYCDNNLVIAISNGRACEYRVIEKEFDAVKKRLELPRLKLGQLKNFSMQDGLIQKIYSQLVYDRELLDRSIAYRDVKQATCITKTVSADFLKSIQPKSNDTFDIFEIAGMLKKDPELACKFARLLNK